MYHHIAGELVVLSPTRAVVEASGVGFELVIPLSTFVALKESASPGARVRLLTHLLVREELHRLYGFHTEEERLLFRAVLGVSGMGPGVALAILSSVDVPTFKRLIEAGDPAPLQAFKGIGKKLAGRLIVELKDRVAELPGGAGPPAGGRGAARGAGRREGASAGGDDALLALLELGFDRAEAERRVRAAREALAQETAEPAVEDVLREALRQREPAR